MFLTDDRAKVFSTLFNPDESLWAYAELINYLPWFFVECQISEETGMVLTNYIFFSPVQLLELTINPSVKINSVYIISTPKINRSRNWKMEQIKILKKGFINERQFQKVIHVIELKNGKRYFSEDFKGAEKNISDLKTIYVI